MKGSHLIVSAVTMLVAVLGLPATAHAEPAPVIALSCPSSNSRINCSVAITVAEGTPSITWVGGANPSLDRNKTARSFRCWPGFTYLVGVEVQTAFFVVAKDFKLATCNGEPYPRRIANIFCQPTPTVGLPNGAYFVCDTLWNGDGSPAAVKWVSPQAKRQPVVTVNTTERWTSATFDCNNPGRPDLTFGAYVSVTDAAGTVTTPYTIPCGW